MVFGFMNGGVWFCRMPGITVGKWTRKWTLTGKNCCRKRWVALWVFSSSLWCLPWSYMRHPFWCSSQYLFASNSKEKMIFYEGKFILYSISWSTFFFGGCEKRSSWIFFLQPHPCTPEKGKKMKWLTTPHFTSYPSIQTLLTLKEKSISLSI